MARSVRRGSVKKRSTKWCGAVADFTVPNPANVVVGDAIPLCQATTATPETADPVAGWCKGSISLSRTNTSDVTPTCVWAIVMGRLSTGSTSVVQIFDPFTEADLERQDILGMGAIPVPGLDMTPSTDAKTPFRDSTVVHINIKVGRKLRRNTNNLFLWVLYDGSDNGVTATCQIRTLMKF